MKRKLTAGQTSVSLPIFVQDTSSTTGGGLSGLTSGTSGLVAEYRRRGQSAWTAITLTSKTLGTWTSGGIVADGSLAGAYELDLPDAVCASGARWVAVRLRGAANMLPCLIEIELDVVDYLTARFGASDGTGVTLAANQDVRNVSGTLPAVTLAASQPNYAPAKAGDEMALTSTVLTALFADVDTGALVSSIVAQFNESTDLPVDTIAALAASRTVTALATLIADAAAAKAAAQSADGKLTAGRLSRVDALPTATAGTTGGLALHGATGGGAGDAEQATLLAVEDKVDAISVALAGSAPVEPTGTTVFQHLEQIQDSIDTYVSSALATVNGTQDTIVGFPDSLTVGDSYTEDSGNAIHVFIRDGNDDPISSVGSHDFTDTDFAPELVITNSGNAGRVRATVTYIDPGSSEPYLKVEIPLAESRRAAPGSATMQCVLKWDGCAKTLATQSVTWVARI